VVFISIGLRLRTEVEALNMVESLGAYTRHRSVSILKRIVKKNGGVVYKLVIAPAISGQTINHGFSALLVELAEGRGLPVCPDCKAYRIRVGFDKRSTQSVDHDTRIKDCVIEDLTGFLAPEAGVKRTAPVSFSYMVPDLEGGKAAIDSQFHVQYNMETNQHRPFTIESGSAIYMLGISVDVDKIGRLFNGNYIPDRIERIDLVFSALTALFEGLGFGAKKSRYLPIIEVVGAIATVSHPIPFVVSPPRIYRDGRNYISDTITRAEHYTAVLKDFNEGIEIVYLDKEGIVKDGGVSAEKADTFSELMLKIKEKTLAMLGLGAKQ